MTKGRSLFVFVLIFLIAGALGAFAQEPVAEYAGEMYYGEDGIFGNKTAVCGDGIADIDAGEQCDGPDFNEQSCSSLLGTNYGGALTCRDNCIFDTSQCVAQNQGGGGGGGGGSSGDSGGTSSGSSGRVASCVEVWQCEDWSECKNGEQTRSCRDLAQCGTTILRPTTERTCIEETPEITEKKEGEKSAGLLGSLLGAFGNLGKSKIAIVVIFIALVVAASLIISALRSGTPAIAGPEAIAAPTGA